MKPAAMLNDNNNNDGVTLWLQIQKKSPVGQMDASSQESGPSASVSIKGGSRRLRLHPCLGFTGTAGPSYGGYWGCDGQTLADSRRRWLYNLAGAAA